MNDNRRNSLIYKLSQLLRCDIAQLDKLTLEQVSYINQYIEKSSFLEACPGSGKTEVIGVKGAYEIKKWKNANGGISVITFTTSAAKEIENRVRKYAGIASETFPHFIGTFDSWLHNFLLQPFCHYLTKYLGKEGDKSIRIIDDASHADFLHSFIVNIQYNGRPIPIKATEYTLALDGSLVGQSDSVKNIFATGISNNEKVALRQNKKAFFLAGFATYADAEMLCTVLLTRNRFLAEKLSKRFPVMFIDECQDLSEGQLTILEFLRSSGTTLHFVGDLNQSIYEFREVDPATILHYINHNSFVKQKLTNNFRSCQQIVNAFESIIGNQDNIVGHEPPVTDTPCILWQYTGATFSQLPTKFQNLLDHNQISQKDSAILARGKSTLANLRVQNDVNRYSKMELFALAIENWHKSNKHTEDIKNAIFYFGKAICWLAYNGQGTSRNQYCPYSLDAIQWRLLLKTILDQSGALYPFEENGADITWSRWVARLKIFLQANWILLQKREAEYNDIIGKLRAPNGKAGNSVKEIGNSSNTTNVFRTTSIHSVKGETLHATMLISHHNRQSQGGHYSIGLERGTTKKNIYGLHM